MEVPPERLVTWVVTFAQRHGGVTLGRAGDIGRDRRGGHVHRRGRGDGRVPPAVPARALRCPERPEVLAAAQADPEAAVRAAAEALAAHAAADRTVGVLLVRLGGYAAGVFSGSPPRLVDSKTGSRPVHGRSAAGGWSQHRFARRRENQAATALRAAADAAAEVFGRYGPDRLDAVVLGGDKRSAAGLHGYKG